MGRGLAACVLSALLSGADGFLIGVDLGREFFKIAAIAPGKPFEIVYNRHSTRKTPTAVSFFESVRGFGDDAVAQQGKAPEKVIGFYPSLLGADFTGKQPDSGLPHDYFPYKLSVDEERGAVHFNFDDQMMSIEEVAAHVFSFMRGISESFIGSKELRDVVVTIPALADQRQRQAIIDAVEIGMGTDKVSLIHETAAAAIQRAMDIEEKAAPAPEPEIGEDGQPKPVTPTKHVIGSGGATNVLFFNMGARHVESCVMRYHWQEGSPGVSVPVIKTLGCGATDGAGGFFADLEIANKMLNAFVDEHKGKAGVRQSKRALKKILAAAKKAKHVLSANKDARFAVEGLFEDTDFAKQIARTEFEEWCQPMFDKLIQPVEEALKISGLSMGDIDEVEVVGGGWRIPKVQSMLADYIQSKRPEGAAQLPLGQHLNGEEAFAMGAAFYSANASVTLRTKAVQFTDLSFHEYSLHITKKGGGDFSKKVKFAPVGSMLGAHKIVSLKDADFDLEVQLLENGAVISTYEITGIADACKQNEGVAPVVDIDIGLDTSGLVDFRSAEVVFETTPEAAPDAEAAPEPVLSVVEAKVALTGQTKPLPMTAAQKEEIRSKVEERNTYESEIKDSDATRNALEGYIYQSREKLESESLQAVTTPEGRDQLTQALNAAGEWLDSNAHTAKLKTLKEKLESVKAEFGPVLKRQREAEDRPRLKESVEKTLGLWGKTKKHVKKDMPWVDEDEVEKVQEMVDAFTVWYDEAQAQQKDHAPEEDPVFRVADAKQRIMKIVKASKDLTNIKKSVAEKKQDAEYWKKKVAVEDEGFDEEDYEEFKAKNNESGSLATETDAMKAYYDHIKAKKRADKDNVEL